MIIFGSEADNILAGAAGDDVVQALGGADVVRGGSGHDVLLGDDEDDLTEDGDDVVEGEDGDDILVSGHGFDVLKGGAGDDFLYNGVGFHTSGDAWSGAGEPNYDSNSAKLGDVVTLDGGSGFDRVILNYSGLMSGVSLDFRDAGRTNAITTEGANAGSALSIEQLFFLGGAGGDIITATTGDDVLRGADGADALNGHDGADSLYGDGGADVLAGGAGEDSLFGGDGGDQLDGGSGADLLIGGDGNDSLTGGEGADSLLGEDGDDVLTGGVGGDSLDGGVGTDIAVYNLSSTSATWSQNADGSWKVMAGAEGVDALSGIEVLRFTNGDVTLSSTPPAPSTPSPPSTSLHQKPGSGVSVNFQNPASYGANLRDFNGNDLGGASGWTLIGSFDVQNDGDVEYILVNRQIGRWATVGPAENGLVYFQDHGQGGDTRVVGIYVDPLVQSGQVAKGGPHDSQTRFQNDLAAGNIGRVLGGGDYDKDGLQEVYFALSDKSAYLHAYMHRDGNIQYANYQSQQQVTDFLTANGVSPSTWSGWFT